MAYYERERLGIYVVRHGITGRLLRECDTEAAARAHVEALHRRHRPAARHQGERARADATTRRKIRALRSQLTPQCPRPPDRPVPTTALVDALVRQLPEIAAVVVAELREGE